MHTAGSDATLLGSIPGIADHIGGVHNGRTINSDTGGIHLSVYQDINEDPHAHCPPTPPVYRVSFLRGGGEQQKSKGKRRLTS